jgi:hypothetical protein
MGNDEANGSAKEGGMAALCVPLEVQSTYRDRISRASKAGRAGAWALFLAIVVAKSPWFTEQKMFLFARSLFFCIPCAGVGIGIMAAAVGFLVGDKPGAHVAAGLLALAFFICTAGAIDGSGTMNVLMFVMSPILAFAALSAMVASLYLCKNGK